MRPLRLLFLLPVLAALLLLAACSGVDTRPSAAQQAAIERASALQDAGDYAGAARAWQALADAHPARRDAYWLRAAESWRQLDAWGEARPLLERIRRSHLGSGDAHHLDLLQAGAALDAGDAERALQLTADAATLGLPWRLRALELRARAQLATGRALAAARTRLAMDADLRGYEREQNQETLLAALAGMNAPALQDAAAQLDAADPLRAWIGDALRLQGNSLADAPPALGAAVGTQLPSVGAEVSIEGWAPPTQVALLLPGGGALRAAGAAVQDGFTTLAEQQRSRLPDTRLQVLDTGGNVHEALRAYDQAVASGADLVVGPLAPEAVTALFQRAPLPVPLLALNHPEQGVPPAGSAEFALLPEAEGVQVAQRLLDLGLDRAVVFRTDSSWAERTVQAFAAQFARHGGEISAQATLPTTEVNYADAIVELIARADARTGIFIAMAPDQGRLLVPQLRIARVTQPLFATSRIWAAETNPGRDRDLDGVIFCDAPWLFNAQAGLPRRAALEENANTRGPAARLFAFGMDAWSLLPYLQWMQAHPGSHLAGATGELVMDELGRIQRVPIWAQFVNGVARPLTGALSLDELLGTDPPEQ